VDRLYPREIRLRARGVEDSSPDDNNSLAIHIKKGGRFKRNFRQTFKDERTSSISGYDHKRDMSRIQCFRCDKYGHYARNCLIRKKGNMLPPLTLILTHLKRMKTREMRITSSKPNASLSITVV
jgi:hypothetical protein